MAKFKVNHNENYSIIANCIFKDKRLSWKAKGILANMLSLPDNWDYSLAGLEKLSNDGMSATRSALKELEEFGYLIRRPIRENGRIKDWEYLIFEEPQKENQVLEKPLVENQQVENQTQLNNNTINKEINKINNKSIVGQSHDIAVKIIDYLNEKAGTRFEPVDSNIKLIKARLKNYTEEDLKSVINKKVKEWKGTELQQYIRPKTLFNATNFENYINGLAEIKEQSQTKYSKEDIADVFSNLEYIDV